MQALGVAVGDPVFDAMDVMRAGVLGEDERLFTSEMGGNLTAAATGIATVPSSMNEARRAQNQRFTLTYEAPS